MPETTFCPLLLIAVEGIPIERINEKLLDFAREFIDYCKKYEINVSFSKDTMSKVYERYPWHFMQDKRIKQYVTHWQNAVLGPLQKICTFEDVENELDDDDSTCSVINDFDLCLSWENWLESYSDGTQINGVYIKGIAATNTCFHNDTRSNRCENFTLTFDENGWNKIRFPIYHKYPNSLPTEGEHPFVPPENWENMVIQKGPNHGYLDRDGNEWKWDLFHRNHWDVTDPQTNRHINVTPDGRIL